MITLWVMDEWSFDRYHEKDARLFQVMERAKTEEGIETVAQTREFLAEVLAAELPEIEYAVTVTPPFFFPAFSLTGNEKLVKGTGKYVDKDFLELFTYPLLYGSKQTALTDMNSIVLSERVARALFRDISKAVGQTLEYQLFTLRKSVMVTGVMRNVPANSSEHFDFLLPFDAFRDIMAFKRETLDWEGRAPFFTYVTVKEGVNIVGLNDKLAEFLGGKTASAKHRRLFLKPFSDNYLYGRYKGEVATGRIEYVRLFTLIAAFVLLIACVNFMNLSTARASRRLREIGIKKVVGAGRGTLAFQYLAESMMMAFLSLAVALLLVDLLLPRFNVISGKSLSLSFDAGLVVACVCITVITGLLAGSYPAFMLSALNAINVLSGKIQSSPGEWWVRRGLVVFQFSLSVTFIIGVAVVYQQLNFVHTMNLGYDRDNVISFGTTGELAGKHESFLNEVRKIPGVANASSMLGSIIQGRGDSPGGGMGGTHFWRGKEVLMSVSQVNYDLIETLGIEIKAGRSFTRGHGPAVDADGRTLQYIYNEAAIEALGIEDAVGLVLPGGMTIVGVARNFHFRSLHESVQPHCFMLEPKAVSNILVKIAKGTEAETLERIERFHKSFNPGYRFEFKFLDNSYEALYASEKRVASLSAYAAGLTIVISCLGLFGLAAFTAERRTREIGIRKVLGASVFGIVYLLSAEFTKVVIVSILIAIPVGLVIAEEWLATFAYRISVEWWYFAAAALLALIIAWLTVSAQAFRAARVDPVKCLRDE